MEHHLQKPFRKSSTLRETHIFAPEKWWLEDNSFPFFLMAYVQNLLLLVSREGISSYFSTRSIPWHIIRFHPFPWKETSSWSSFSWAKKESDVDPDRRKNPIPLTVFSVGCCWCFFEKGQQTIIHSMRQEFNYQPLLTYTATTHAWYIHLIMPFRSI